MRKMINGLKIVDERNTFKRRTLRKRATPAEKKLWYWLKKNLPEYKWRRQHSLGYYIADFYCHDKKLVIELDGHHHDKDEEKEYDLIRTKLFNEFQIQVVRFYNEEIINNLSAVVEKIESILKELGTKSQI